MIEIKNVSKSFGKNNVLKNISLGIESSKITVIAGPNSSGKTTLIKSVLGLVKIDRGQITVTGKDIKDSEIYREKIGYMPQIGRFPENQSINEVFKMICDLRNSQSPDNLKKLIEIFGLTEHLPKKMGTLSGGTRQKVAAVIAFLFEPSILILDEPTTGLDPLSSLKLKEILVSEKAKGNTVIIITHNISEAEELADNLVFILDGEVRFNGGIPEVLQITGSNNLDKALTSLLQKDKNE